MKRGTYTTLTGAFAISALLAFVWFAMPHTTAGVLLRLNNLSAGLSERTVRTEIGDIRYLEGGQGETIVLLHGIYSRKEHWVDFARHLEKDYHIIALDLPGFGDNQILEQNQYELRNQQANLPAVIDALELDKFHVAANSMGAQVAALMADAQPERILSFAFIGSPLGVSTPVKSDMERALAQGQIPLLARTEEEFNARTDWLFPKPPKILIPIISEGCQLGR